MALHIKQLVPTSGWYWLGPEVENAPRSRFPVAVWAQLETGEVVGLISVDMKQAVTDANIARLVSPPPIGGSYVLEKDLPSYIPE